VPLTKQNVDLGCLRVREGSHLGFRDFCDKAERFETLKNRTGDWCMLNKEELDKHFPQDKYPIVNVESEPGDVVLWFSHTLHEGQVPREPGADPRLVFYICQVPRFHVPQSHYVRALSLAFSFLCIGCENAAIATPPCWREEETQGEVGGQIGQEESPLPHAPHDQPLPR
jgi:ectoine hydroxylase-related dioxygenase (phytanoyl-CoA dioxygenase family)